MQQPTTITIFVKYLTSKSINSFVVGITDPCTVLYSDAKKYFMVNSDTPIQLIYKGIILSPKFSPSYYKIPQNAILYMHDLPKETIESHGFTHEILNNLMDSFSNEIGILPNTRVVLFISHPTTGEMIQITRTPLNSSRDQNDLHPQTTNNPQSANPFSSQLPTQTIPQNNNNTNDQNHRFVRADYNPNEAVPEGDQTMEEILNARRTLLSQMHPQQNETNQHHQHHIVVGGNMQHSLGGIIPPELMDIFNRVQVISNRARNQYNQQLNQQQRATNNPPTEQRGTTSSQQPTINNFDPLALFDQIFSSVPRQQNEMEHFPNSRQNTTTVDSESNRSEQPQTPPRHLPTPSLDQNVQQPQSPVPPRNVISSLQNQRRDLMQEENTPQPQDDMWKKVRLVLLSTFIEDDHQKKMDVFKNVIELLKNEFSSVEMMVSIIVNGVVVLLRKMFEDTTDASKFGMIRDVMNIVYNNVYEYCHKHQGDETVFNKLLDKTVYEIIELQGKYGEHKIIELLNRFVRYVVCN